ncbi:MAG TPA: ribose-5-phosphate isomerase RpiA, partial [Planctomycetota bacterium]|nr:ribose-5-phosphate isomerase RpiA [Planctomycetota bacterium]
MPTQDGATLKDPKQVAGSQAASLVEDGMVVGLGTGSTVYFTLQTLAQRIQTEGLRIQGVPTSIDTEDKAREMGIPLIGLDRVERIDLTIDGADEADHDFRLTKGGGGALLREKVVAYLSDRVAIVMTPNKLVRRLGQTFALPVEVVPFAGPVIARELTRLGAEVQLRTQIDGRAYLTDNHNQIYDCRFPAGIEDPVELERHLAHVPGVVESGLFIGLAHHL